MSRTPPEYVRVYQSIVDDEKFATIFDDDHHLAAWLRLLMAADATWPASAPIPISTRRASLSALSAVGLIDVTGSRFRVHGLDNEREVRANAGRIGGMASAIARTTVERSLNGRSRDAGTKSNLAEKSLEEKSRAEDARAPDIVDDYYRLTTRWPSTAITEWLERLSAEFGYDSTSRQLATQFRADPSARTILGRVENDLKSAQHTAAKVAADREAERLEKWASDRRITPEDAEETRRQVLAIQSQWQVKEIS